MNDIPSNRLFRGRYLGDRIEWEELPPFPGPARVQPMMAFSGDRIILAGGFRYAVGEGEPQIPGEVLCYDIAKGIWEVWTDSEMSSMPIGAREWLPIERGERFARAGASAVVTDNGTLLTVCGELKPGIRTAAVGVTALSGLPSAGADGNQ